MTVEHQISALAQAQAIVAEALRRMRDAAAAGQDTLASIERMRLENAVDLCRIWLRELDDAGAAGEQVTMEGRMRLHEIQAAFAVLQSRSGEISEQPQLIASAAE